MECNNFVPEKKVELENGFILNYTEKEGRIIELKILSPESEVTFYQNLEKWNELSHEVKAKLNELLGDKQGTGENFKIELENMLRDQDLTEKEL